jgi:aspartyl-tRNA(Asn)/glutamyl-tRNA(Gln) amidotransferase subunit A
MEISERLRRSGMPEVEKIATLEEALGFLRRGEITAVTLAENYLARIEALDSRVRAFVTVTRERALADAAAADERRRGGQERPLDGIPVAIKDIVATRGIRTTAGSRVLADWVPDADAPVAQALAVAGTSLLGKTNTHEFAFGTFTPPTRNPWDLDRIPGGSSGGSAAAVAAGMCLGAVGTDTGGSIRMPAACCGVTGFKPTYGLVSAERVVPLSWSLDHVGPIARSARDCALLLDAMVRDDPFEPLRPVPNFAVGANLCYADVPVDAAVIAGLRLGVPANYFFSHVEPKVEEKVRTAVGVLSSLGVEVEEVRVPEAIDDLFAVYLAFQRPEARTAHEDAGWFPAQADLYAPPARRALERAGEYSAADYIRGQRAKQAFAREMDALLRRVDVLATPTLPLVAPLVADAERPLMVAGREEWPGPALVRLTFPFDISGQPALTVPCGFSASGLPIGLQLVGARYDDMTLLRLGYAYQRETDWHLRWPP